MPDSHRESGLDCRSSQYLLMMIFKLVAFEKFDELLSLLKGRALVLVLVIMQVLVLAIGRENGQIITERKVCSLKKEIDIRILTSGLI